MFLLPMSQASTSFPFAIAAATTPPPSCGRRRRPYRHGSAVALVHNIRAVTTSG